MQEKTDFIRELWNGKVKVKLITGLRCFGKTLTMSQVEFFPTRFVRRGNLFEGLKVWEGDQFRMLQGTVPVINFSLKSAKEKNYESMVQNGVAEKRLEETADSAIKQIKEKGYETALLAEGIAKERIFKSGMAFSGKEALTKLGK